MYSQCTILQSYTKIQILYNSDKDNVLILKTHNVDLIYILATCPPNLYRPYNSYWLIKHATMRFINMCNTFRLFIHIDHPAIKHHNLEKSKIITISVIHKIKVLTK